MMLEEQISVCKSTFFSPYFPPFPRDTKRLRGSALRVAPRWGLRPSARSISQEAGKGRRN